MTDPVRTAEELSEKSKHQANYMYHQLGSGKERYAVEAETLFFFWLWRKG